MKIQLLLRPVDPLDVGAGELAASRPHQPAIGRSVSFAKRPTASLVNDRSPTARGSTATGRPRRQEEGRRYDR